MGSQDVVFRRRNAREGEVLVANGRGAASSTVRAIKAFDETDIKHSIGAPPVPIATMSPMPPIRPLALILLGACASGGTEPMATALPPPTILPARPPSLPSLDTPEAAVAAYFRAGDERASALTRAAFHPATPIQWVEPPGVARARHQIEWWPRIDAADGTPARSRRQRTIDRSGGLALVEATSHWDSHTFDDLLVVAQDGDSGGWQIVGKVFQRLAPGETSVAASDDEAAIQAVLEQKTAAHAAYDPSLLLASHLADCLYFQVGERATTYASLSEWGARYAVRSARGEHGRDDRWRVLRIVVRGSIAGAVLDVQSPGRRIVDHLLLLKVEGHWKIAAAAWAPLPT
jgi:hypothetical protein